MAKPRVIYWFRTDLRLHDSPALKAALDLKPDVLWPIWTWDPHYVYRARVGVNRWQFLIDCQNDLSHALTALNPNSKLFLLREAPQTLLPKLFKAWSVTHLVFEKDTDAYARARDAEILEVAREAGVKTLVISGRTLWDSDELVKKNGGKPTMSISQVQSAGPKVGEIPRPIPAPTEIPGPGEVDLEGVELEGPVSEPDFNAGWREKGDRLYEKLAGPKGDFAPPTVEELGFPAATTQHRGGETVALKMLDEIIANETYTATFEKPKTAPTAFEPQATTLLSPHLHFGSLSVREFYWRVQDVVDGYKKGKASQPPVSLTGQLLFRDMYFGAQAELGYAFSQTLYNDHCRFIPWHLPSKVDHSTQLVTGGYHIDTPDAETWFRRWKDGRTGFPFIDALMRQLRLEGWIHHLGRHAVACFLTRGGCYISWERGAEVFEEWLLDHETACNAGNWQWLSCTAFFAQFYRCYSPIAFGKKWDPEGTFVRKYVPELAALDKKYIYEPWKAPLADQKKAGVRITGDGEKEEKGVYPKPMFDFPTRRDICLDGMKKAYHVGLYGAHPKVVDGTWRTLFDDAGEGPTEGKTFEDAMGHEVEEEEEGDGSKIRDDAESHDDAVQEDEKGAMETGGETKGGDEDPSPKKKTKETQNAGASTKRKRGQGTLDAHVKRSKK